MKWGHEIFDLSQVKIGLKHQLRCLKCHFSTRKPTISVSFIECHIKKLIVWKVHSASFKFQRGGIVIARAKDSESRGPSFDPHWQHRVVSLSKTH